MRGKMFPNGWGDNYDAIWEYGVGAMFWRDDRSVPVLYVIVPRAGVRRKRAMLKLRMHNNGEDWRKKGNKIMWDGNWEAPTLNASIRYPDQWHGWIEKGKLVDAGDSEARCPE